MPREEWQTVSEQNLNNFNQHGGEFFKHALI